MDAIRVRVNGEPRRLDGAVTLADLVAEMVGGEGVAGVAAAVNGAVVPRKAWAETRLADGDAIEVVRAVQGG